MAHYLDRYLLVDGVLGTREAHGWAKSDMLTRERSHRRTLSESGCEDAPSPTETLPGR